VFLVSGESTNFGVQFQHSLSRTTQTRHTLVIGIDEHRYRDVVDYFGTNLGASVTSRPASLGYQFQHNNPDDSVAAALTLQRNVPGGALNDDATYAAARAGASAKWQTLGFDGSWQHRFKAGWMSALRLTAQHSNSPLIASGQFGVGGQSAVRGFSENEGAGDSGWLTRIEIYTPVLGNNHRLLGFVDSGSSKRINAQAGELGAQELSSYGLGWRAQYSSGWSLAADAAFVAKGTSLHPAGSKRVHLLANWQF
jgi:hemolysin activation/secretion protein